ncbi:MAG: ABC transporter permease [Chloroflexi bacterium]|nr:MAG: ABC transporter permease [Chloroflexota bacterium]
MATTTQQAPTNVVQIHKAQSKGESLWYDAWKRLRRNRFALIGAVIILLNVIMAVFAPQIAPQDFRKQDLLLNNATPRWVLNIFPSMVASDEGGYVTVSNKFILGADNLGRDLFSRIVYGSRVSLLVAFVGATVSVLIGVPFGLLSGYLGGRVDNGMMRFVDLMYAFPALLFIILLMSFFRASFVGQNATGITKTLSDIDAASGGMIFIFIGIGLTSWMRIARLTRGQTLATREAEYITAARSMGTTTPTIIYQHILPNILGPIIVTATLTIPVYISFEAFLSFIGLGVNPPTPSWGAMISEGAANIRSFPNQAVFPALALFLVMFAFNFLGDGLRDALDPRMRGVD